MALLNNPKGWSARFGAAIARREQQEHDSVKNSIRYLNSRKAEIVRELQAKKIDQDAYDLAVMEIDDRMAELSTQLPEIPPDERADHDRMVRAAREAAVAERKAAEQKEADEMAVRMTRIAENPQKPVENKEPAPDAGEGNDDSKQKNVEDEVAKLLSAGADSTEAPPAEQPKRKTLSIPSKPKG